MAIKTGVRHAFIVHNANPTFWEHMGYESISENSPLVTMLSGVTIVTPQKIMHKDLITQSGYNN